MTTSDAEALAEATAIARRGRRRRNASQGARSCKTEIKLTPEELAEFRARADELGITVPAYFIRMASVGGTDAAAEYEQLRDELKMVLRFLAAVSTNVNQLARQANAAAAGVEGVVPVTGEQLAAMLGALGRSLAGVDALTAKIRRVGRR